MSRFYPPVDRTWCASKQAVKCCIIARTRKEGGGSNIDIPPSRPNTHQRQPAAALACWPRENVLVLYIADFMNLSFKLAVMLRALSNRHTLTPTALRISTHLEGIVLEPRLSAQRLPHSLQSIVDLANVDTQEDDHEDGDRSVSHTSTCSEPVPQAKAAAVAPAHGSSSSSTHTNSVLFPNYAGTTKQPAKEAPA